MPSIILAPIKIVSASGEVTFGDSKDGAFGLRLAPALEEAEGGPPKSGNTIPGTGTIVNAEGATSKDVWGKPSNWVDYSGEIDGEKVGITMFDHPENSRRARWHSCRRADSRRG